MTDPVIEYNSKTYGSLKAWRLSDDLPISQLTDEFIRENYPQSIILLDDAERIVLIRDHVLKVVGYNCVEVSTLFPDLMHCFCHVYTARSTSYLVRVEIDFISKVNPAEQIDRDCRANSPAWVYQ